MNNPYEILNASQNFVVVGINNKPETYANRIYKLLERKTKQLSVSIQTILKLTVRPFILHF
ncbi:CoA-binding domain-containing protein [Erysipelothrix rhusiopathiae SY1027]|uniref:CoA-binding domain-containing protein n=1 Tax=Erysipelothrix rhusiopathiae TaxID=1648 RepID=UPI0003348EC9|nr:CoA-binding domain-containing protein [Erysipelothrix rhusiopathiae]AGN25349.1 CoA-binding domain-containing protein [Erysipelothrix rhusiopathiae SY1027]